MKWTEGQEGVSGSDDGISATWGPVEVDQQARSLVHTHPGLVEGGCGTSQ